MITITMSAGFCGLYAWEEKGGGEIGEAALGWRGLDHVPYLGYLRYRTLYRRGLGIEDT